MSTYTGQGNQERMRKTNFCLEYKPGLMTSKPAHQTLSHNHQTKVCPFIPSYIILLCTAKIVLIIVCGNLELICMHHILSAHLLVFKECMKCSQGMILHYNVSGGRYRLHIFIEYSWVMYTCDFPCDYHKESYCLLKQR